MHKVGRSLFFILLARALTGVDEVLASGLANTDLLLPAVVVGIDSTLAVIVDALKMRQLHLLLFGN